VSPTKISMTTKHFCFDVETMGVESSSIVLSAALVWFDPADTSITFEQLVERAVYVKFSAMEQKKAGRTVDKDTMLWWSKQGEVIYNLCVKGSKSDLLAVEGLGILRDYVKKHGSKDSFIWTRGSLDQMVIESLCRSTGEEKIADYNAYMDVRTAIRLLKDTSKWTGYCDIPDFDWNKVSKHNPIDDIALDVLMLVKGV
jgi:hypothetical protein